jgi:hypothetical protein
MSDPAANSHEMEELVKRLQDSYRALTRAIGKLTADDYAKENAEGDSIRQILERAVDDVHFYYGKLIAGAVSLPQPPELKPAELATAEQAKAAVQAAHRSVSRLLNDLHDEDLERKTKLGSTAEYTLRQVLETATAHYRLRSEQLAALRNSSEG